VSELNEHQKDMIAAKGLSNAIHGCRVLVTGAGGFVGLHLVEALVGLGANVHALSRSIEKRGLPQNIHMHSVDMQRSNALRRCIKEVKPDVVYHLAGLVNTRQYLSLVLPTLRNNVMGSVHLFLALAEETCNRLIVVGSSEEPAAGHLRSVANSPYAVAKEAETSYAKMFHSIFSLPVVVARPFMSYGPRQPVEKIIPYVITSLLQGIPPQISSGRRVCDLIYVQDLVMGLILSGFCPNLTGEAIDLGAGVGVTIRDTANLISSLVAGPVKPLFGAIPDRLYESPQIANDEETFRLLGYRPIWSLQDGLKATIEWYRQNPGFYAQS
jgi:nucleoside-diphosphate-sugar epimerase